MPIKIIFIDVDNTLYDHKNGEFPPSTVAALNKAHANGVKIVISSGRSLALIDNIGATKIAPIFGYVAANGAMVYDEKGRLMFDTSFSPEDMRYIFQECAKQKVGLQYINDKQDYINIPLNDSVKKACDDFRMPYPLVKPFEGERICQLLMFADEEEEKRVAYAFKDRFNLHRFHPFCVDIIAENNNKGTAVKKFLELTRIKKEEAMAIGDGDNDVQMLNNVGYGVAMGNATETLKKAADYVTTSVDKRGVYNALKHYKII